jgi:hypothetical protein
MHHPPDYAYGRNSALVAACRAGAAMIEQYAWPKLATEVRQ